MLIQSTTVGKAATFTKVDCIVKEARAIMRLTSRVVQMCFANADKYNLDFSHITAEGRSNSETDGSNPGSFGGSGNTSDS